MASKCFRLFCVLITVQSAIVCDAYILRNLSQRFKREDIGHIQDSADDVAEVQMKQEFADKHEPLNTTFIINSAKDIIHSGLNNIKNDIEEVPENVDNVRPSEGDWRELNQTLDHFFDGQFKQDNASNQLIDAIKSGFQNFTERFLLKLEQRQFINSGYERQRPGFISQLFVGGTQQVASDINNLGNPTTTTAAVTVTTSKRPNFINNVISSFSGSTQASPLPQAATEIANEQPSTAAPGFFQGAFNNIVNNFRPTITTTTTTTTTTTQRTPMDLLQNWGNQIGTALQQANIFGQTARPAEDEITTTTQPLNLVQNIGQALQNANPFKPPEMIQALQANKETTSPTKGPMEMFVCFNLAKIISNIRNR